MKQPLRDPLEMTLPRIEENPRYAAVAAEISAIQARMKQAEQRERVAGARQRGQQPTRSLVERAADLLKGGTVVSSEPTGELEAAQQEQFILRKAEFAARDRLDAVVGELSHEACLKFAGLNADALRAALAAATDLHLSLEVARLIRGKLLGSGYWINDAALPTHMFPVAAAVGDPNRVGASPAALFKQWLRDRGVI
jgi:hypothetical protein